ncbi:MAG: hypothetical protein K2N87_01680 [Eubacterium sp.]|nr:hypothetical protein [Eubacterium sp.]
MAALAGGGVKQAKEGRKMPAVKKLCQEPENSAKPEFIHGHMFGGLGILMETPPGNFSASLFACGCMMA